MPKENHENFSSDSKPLAFSNDKDFEKKMEIVTDIKIEEFNIDEATGSVSNENIANEEKDEEQNDDKIEESIKLNTVSVRLNRLSKSQLRNHLKVNQEPINSSNMNVTEFTSKSCEICDKTFSTVQALKMHIEAVHQGLKKYKCIKCGKSFGHAGSLKKHNETVHEGLKNYKCNKCGKAFGDFGNFKRHNKIIHEGMKKYKCCKCDKSFGQAVNLKRHNETVHEGLKKL